MKGNSSVSGRAHGQVYLRAALIVLVILAAACQPITYRVIRHARIDTDGRSRGVAAQDKYAFVADGDGGLKIINIYNPAGLVQDGNVALDGFCSHVAVEGDIVVLTDDTQNRVFFVNVFDKHKPVLTWTYTTLDKVRSVAIQGGTAFLAERGDDPTAPSFFTGLEAVSCSLTAAPAKLNQAAILDVRAVAATSSSVFVIGPQNLTVLARSATGFTSAPLATLNLGSGEDLQSVDARAGTSLFILGNSLYLVDVTNSSKPVIADSQAVSGYGQNRVISTTGILGGASSGASQPQFVRFAYSTLHEYGIGLAEVTAKKIAFCVQVVDADKESKGHIQIYDIDMRLDFTTHFNSGDVLAVGALDDYGLGVAY
jgi:hypothetical protein